MSSSTRCCPPPLGLVCQRVELLNCRYDASGINAPLRGARAKLPGWVRPETHLKSTVCQVLNDTSNATRSRVTTLTGIWSLKFESTQRSA